MDNIVDLDSRKPHWNGLALCLDCLHKWVATFPVGAPLFHFECPRCGEQNSFVSLIPAEYETLLLAQRGIQ